MAYYWNKDGNVMDREIRRKESVAFFTNVKSIAEKNGLNNKELAQVLGVHPTLLYKYLGGIVVPREDGFETMKKHAVDFFDVSITELIDGNVSTKYEKVVTEEPTKEEDRTNPNITEWTDAAMRVAINQRKDRIARLQMEIDALELALTLMKDDHIL